MPAVYVFLLSEFSLQKANDSKKLLLSADSLYRTKCFLIVMSKKKIQWTHDIRLFGEIISAQSPRSRKNLL